MATDKDDTAAVVEIRPATRRDAAAISAVLTDAFCDTDTYRWIVPDRDARRRAVAAVFTANVRHLHPPEDGPLVATVAGRLAGAAVWVRPGRWRPSAARWLAVLPGIVRMAGSGSLWALATRGGAVGWAMTRAHPRQPHWYLGTLGVAPVDQGGGTGADLLRAGLDLARRDGLPAYLECELPLIDYYRRFGFTVRGDIPLPPGAPAHVGLWWDPEVSGSRTGR